jgi:pimeloyl-ACP methyl ester carboxylesterase
MKAFLAICLAAALCLPAQGREQFRVSSAPEVSLSLIEVGQHKGKRPILLIHGARVSAVGSFDLQVPGGSLAADLAARGFDVYLLDVRGYGASSRPAEMNEAPERKPALVRSSDAVEDIDAALDFIRQRSSNAKVALLGWATGGQWAGHYASLHSDKLSALIMLNSLYRGGTRHAMIGRGSSLDDKGRFNTAACGAYRLNDAASVMRPWDSTLGDLKDSAGLCGRGAIQRPHQRHARAAQLPFAMRRNGGQLLPRDRPPTVGCLIDYRAGAGDRGRTRFLVPSRRHAEP